MPRNTLESNKKNFLKSPSMVANFTSHGRGFCRAAETKDPAPVRRREVAERPDTVESDFGFVGSTHFGLIKSDMGRT